MSSYAMHYRQQARRSAVTVPQTPVRNVTVSQTRVQTSRIRERFFRFPDPPAPEARAHEG